jgi:hypothetical protein
LIEVDLFSFTARALARIAIGARHFMVHPYRRFEPTFRLRPRSSRTFALDLTPRQRGNSC